MATVVLFGLFPSVVRAQVSIPPVELVRELLLDGATEDFSEVNGGHVNHRGDLALTLRQDFQVRVYDSNGRRIATIGRRGSGPGEFERPQVQGWNGDTVWIYDFGLRRNSFFSRTGQLLRTSPLETSQRQIRVTNEKGGARLIDFSPSVRRGDGGLIGVGTILRQAPTAHLARELVVASYSTNGGAVRLASLAADPRWAQELAFTNMFAIAPTGNEVLDISVSDLSLTGSTVLLTRVSVSGVRGSSIRLPYRGLPYPISRRDSILRRGVGIDRGHNVPASMVPAVLPPVWGALLRDDRMALLTMQKTVNSLTVVIVDPKGMRRGEFTLPKSYELLAAKGQQVWLRSRDDDGIVSIVRYRLRCAHKEGC